MFCRKTKIALIYSIRDKTMAHIVPILKKHIARGHTIFSDSHMSYCNLNNGTSKLSKFGFFHMWTNHSMRMVHEKFNFNHTLNIERAWGDIKRVCYHIKSCLNYDKIQEYCDTYLLRKRICKKRCIYDFTMRLIHQYYVAHYNEILK
jgi:hypothetical protein